MKRECELLYPYPDENSSRGIYIDKINKDEIIKFIKQDDRYLEKFRFFVQLFLSGKHNEDIYKKEDINEYCKDVTAIRFFPGQENDRVYCKEIKSKSRIITVMCVLHEHKTTQKNTGRENKNIKIAATYEYEIK